MRQLQRGRAHCWPPSPRPVPDVAGLIELNELIAAADAADDTRVITGRASTIGAALAAEGPMLSALPVEPFDAARLLEARVDGRARCVFGGATTRCRPDSPAVAAWVTQAARNLVMDLDEAGGTVTYLIRDRDAKFPALFDRVLTDAGIATVLTGVRMQRMNSIMERWVQTCRHELLDRTLIWNESHLRHRLRRFELHHNEHASPGVASGRSATCGPRTDHRSRSLAYLDIRRNDRLGGMIHEYQHAV